ncbi:MAG: hypothetical protein NVS3B7_13080 [Candidatus Elarobacter sp.]
MAVSVALTAGTASQAATPIQLPLKEQNASGEHGTATLFQGVKGVIVKVRLSGAPESIDQPAHIHKGTCEKLDPKPMYALTLVKNGQSQTTIPNVTLAELQGGAYAINVHKSTKEVPVYVSCGNLTASK